MYAGLVFNIHDPTKSSLSFSLPHPLSHEMWLSPPPLFVVLLQFSQQKNREEKEKKRRKKKIWRTIFKVLSLFTRISGIFSLSVFLCYFFISKSLDFHFLIEPVICEIHWEIVKFIQIYTGMLITYPLNGQARTWPMFASNVAGPPTGPNKGATSTAQKAQHDNSRQNNYCGRPCANNTAAPESTYK